MQADKIIAFQVLQIFQFEHSQPIIKMLILQLVWSSHKVLSLAWKFKESFGSNTDWLEAM